ncbi:MAG: ZIP family metal transporter [Firmicutes bacterium]|nr:ZIP family metal transporter [Bacillota bacterium]
MTVIFSYGLLAGLATTLGSLLFIVFGPPGRRSIGFALGLASGVMLAVVVIDLVPTSLEHGGWTSCLLGMIIGCLLIKMADARLDKTENTVDSRAVFKKLGILTALGIALHDLPEGMAIALGYSATERLGPIIALAIGIHNIPEGIAITAPLRAAGVSMAKILFLNLVVALVTPAGTGAGLLLANQVPGCLSMMLGLASGTMTYLVASALAPAAFRTSTGPGLTGALAGTLLIVAVNQVL